MNEYIKHMLINGINVQYKHDKNGELIVTVNDEEEITINPNVISQAWVLYNSKRFDLIRFNHGWKENIYEYIASNDNPDIKLIALLLSFKLK